jgi:hypothetical protein
MNAWPSDSDFPSAELLRRVQAQSEPAAAAVFARYVQRLTRLARRRLAARLAARVDPEDIVQSAYRSFFVAARQGRYEVRRGGDLWRLLVEVTLHKLYRQAERHGAKRRSVQRERATSEGSVWQRIAGSSLRPSRRRLLQKNCPLCWLNFRLAAGKYWSLYCKGMSSGKLRLAWVAPSEQCGAGWKRPARR